MFPNGLASRFHQIVFQPLTDAAAAEAREYAFAFEADTETVQLRGAQDLPRRRPGRRGDRERRGRRPTTRRSRCTRARAPSTCTSRGSTRATSSSCATASRTSPRATRSPTTSARSSYMQSTEPIARTRVRAHHAEVAARSTSTSRTSPGLAQKVEEKGDTKIWHFIAENVAPLEPEPMMPPLDRDRSATCTCRPTRPGTTWAAGTGASCAISSPPTTRSAGASPRSRRASPTTRRRSAPSTTTSSRRRATSRSSSASTASSRTAARRSSRAASATAKTRRRSSSRC